MDILDILYSLSKNDRTLLEMNDFIDINIGELIISLVDKENLLKIKKENIIIKKNKFKILNITFNKTQITPEKYSNKFFKEILKNTIISLIKKINNIENITLEDSKDYLINYLLIKLLNVDFNPQDCFIKRIQKETKQHIFIPEYPLSSKKIQFSKKNNIKKQSLYAINTESLKKVKMKILNN